jgi:hypothetical protein
VVGDLDIVPEKATYAQSRNAGEQRKEGTTAQALREIQEQVEELGRKLNRNRIVIPPLGLSA